MDQQKYSITKTQLKPYFSPLGVWAFSIGTSIGWGSFVVTCNAYLAQAGIMGTTVGLLLGMAVIMIVTHNLQYMIRQNPNAGGIYSYTRKICGNDYGFLSAWFLLLTYMAVLWANITSVPLFARYFLGDVFRFGFHYQIFGYQVYFGEALLSVVSILLIGLLCANSRKVPQWIMIAAALIFVGGFTLCALWAVFSHSGSGFSYRPYFLTNTSAISQIVRIAVISPWAFIGFENITHFSEEFAFPINKSRKILNISVVLTTILYLFVCLLSISAYPPEYASWLDYLRDMGNLEGLKAIPAFYAAEYYMGDLGVFILMLALLSVILTSLIGNTTALSRLLYAMARNGSASKKLQILNKKHVPAKAVYFIVSVSLLIPFLGRTAIGWIVDVTTLGSTIIYGIASYAVFVDARRNHGRLEEATGFFGFILMVGFAAMLLFPNLLSAGAMAPESYILFTIWAMLGLAYFRWLVIKDQERKYGHSMIVWVMLLLLVLFTGMMWVTRATQSFTNNTMMEIRDYYEDNIGNPHTPEQVSAYLQSRSDRINNVNTLYTVASFVIFIISTAIMMTNYHLMQKREKEHQRQLELAENTAATDALTGVKNRLAYARYENALNDQIQTRKAVEFAIVIADVNDLKIINDKIGHSAGDNSIRNACKLICTIYKHSPVFRIGGDEFAVILQGYDYENRKDLLSRVNNLTKEERQMIGSSLAVGMAEYDKNKDDQILDVFTRADRMMYEQKNIMKGHSVTI